MYDNELIFRIWSEVPDKNINWFTSSGLLAPIKCNAGNTKQQNYILYQWVLFLEKWCEYWLTKNTILATWFVVRSCFTIVYSGSMYIGNIQWKHCRLETSFEFGNINCILKTYIEYWKHNFTNRGLERLICLDNCHKAFSFASYQVKLPQINSLGDSWHKYSLSFHFMFELSVRVWNFEEYFP